MELFRFIPLSCIQESANNPRRRYDQKKMDELTESVKSNGVLEPILIRPAGTNGELFEIMAGSRRYRAAIAAKLNEIPAIVKDLGDSEALEISVIENLQRDDVHPLEEALGYQMLLQHPGYEIASIAAKIGKDESFIYKRLKLLDLITPAQDAFLNEEINAGHAILIARLQPKDQERAFDACFTDQFGYKQKPGDRHPRSIKQLSGWISENILLDLHVAPFRKDDEALLPEAGSCIKCAKRTGYLPQLFADIAKKDTCTDPSCYETKLQAHINSQLAKDSTLVKITTEYKVKPLLTGESLLLPASKYHTIIDKKDRCESVQKAIVAAGDRDRGHTAEICTDPNCRKHGAFMAGRSVDNSKWKAEQQRQELFRKRKREIRFRILEQACAKISQPYSRRVLELIVMGFWDGLWDDARKAIASQRRWEKIKQKGGGGIDHRAMLHSHFPDFKDVELARFLVELSLARQMDDVPYGGTNDRLIELAKLQGVDVKRINRDVSAESVAAEKKRKASSKWRKQEASAESATEE
jgi:ParB family transcriptional regulator, chromosome partitioning protein